MTRLTTLLRRIFTPRDEPAPEMSLSEALRREVEAEYPESMRRFVGHVSPTQADRMAGRPSYIPPIQRKRLLSGWR